MSEREFEHRSRSPERLVGAFFAMALGGVCVAAPFAMFFVSETPTVRDPVAQFEAATGLELPDTAKLVAARDTHGGMHWEGELQIAFEVDEPTIQRWLEDAAPFGDSWRSEDVPRVPSFTEDVDGIRGAWFDDERLARDSLMWSGAERSRREGSWAHADLVAVDPTGGRVYFCRWDY